MARQLKSHIKNPMAKRESLCQRMSVTFAKKNSEATCLMCQKLASIGQLRTREFEKNENKWTGANRTGEPQYTDKQVRFAQHPQVMTNAKLAALDVGYSESFAETQARPLRKQLSPLILEIQEKAKTISAISVARIQTELASMGFANVLDYFNVAENGELTAKQLNELTRAQASAIQEVKLVEIIDPATDEVKYVIGWLKLADKRANLVELGRTMGMFNKLQIEDKRESTLRLKEIPTEALHQAEAILLSAVRVAQDQTSRNEAIEGEFKKLPLQPPPGEKK